MMRVLNAVRGGSLDENPMLLGCLMLLAVPLYFFIKSGLWLGAAAWVGVALLRMVYLLCTKKTNRSEYGIALIYPVAFFFQRQFETLVLIGCSALMSAIFTLAVQFSTLGYWAVGAVWAFFVLGMLMIMVLQLTKTKDNKFQASDISLVMLAPVWVTLAPWLALIDDQT